MGHQIRRVRRLLLILGLLLLSAGAVSLGQGVQTPSYTLPGAAALIEGCPAFTDPAALLAALETAGSSGLLTDEQAIAILTAAGIETLDGSNPEYEATVESALLMIFDAVNSSMIDPESAFTALTVALAQNSPLEALAALLDEQASPPGILNAIWQTAQKLGYVQTGSAVLSANIELAVEAGVPPGLVVRIAKDALRSGLDPNAQIALLVGTLADGETSPGNAANAVSGKGNGKSEAASVNKPPKPEKQNKGQAKKG